MNIESIADFFTKNTSIVGFDNPRNSLFHTVRGLIEQTLDLALAELDSSSTEPIVIDVTVEQIEADRVKSMLDLYTPDQNSEDGESGKGIQSSDILNLFNPVLSTSGRPHRQRREKHGLGIQMALIWSNKSTGVPVMISSSMSAGDPITIRLFENNISTNTTEIVNGEPQYDSWVGIETKAVILGNWMAYEEIFKYINLMAVIAPYATFSFSFISDKMKFFERFSSIDIPEILIPHLPPEKKCHPHAVDMEILKNLIQNTSSTEVLPFLMDFVMIEETAARSLPEKVSLHEEKDVKSLKPSEIFAIYHALRNGEFKDPSWDNPAGEGNLKAGIGNVFKPKFVEYYTHSQQYSKGHPFVVQVAICLCEEQNIDGKALEALNVYNFVNQVPLVLNQEMDGITRVVNKIK